MALLVEDELTTELAAIADPLRRAAAAQDAFHRTERVLHALRDVRDLALNELRHTEGLSCRAISRELTERGSAISKSAVAEITG